MNTARWVMAHEMQLDRERWQMRQWARLFGTDMDANEESAPPPEFGDAPRVFPLAGLLNPEAYNNFLNREAEPVFDEVSDAAYEQQVRELEAAGALSDIDALGDVAEAQVRQKRDKMFGILDADEPWEKK